MLGPRGDDLPALFLGFAPTRHLRKALKQILDQIFGIFTPGREADQIVGKAQFRARFGRDRGIRGSRGMAQEGLYASEALAQGEEAARR